MSCCAARPPCSSTCADCRRRINWNRSPRNLANCKSDNRLIDPADREARRALFADACRVRRLIALSNPLLDFSEILFIKRHRALYDHMCDQYYGMAAAPGGGLYVLSDAFGPDPQVRDVLEHSVVAAPARLAGQPLRGGPLGPVSVSFDGMGNRQGTEGQGGTFLSPGSVLRWPEDPVRLRREHRRHASPTPCGSAPGTLGGGTLLSRFQRQRRWVRTASTHRRHLE